MHYPYLYSSFYNVQNSTEGYNKINNWPLNFLRTGGYNRSLGYIDNRTQNGYWWANASSSDTGGRRLATSPTYVGPQDGLNRGYGFAIRCVTREG